MGLGIFNVLFIFVSQLLKQCQALNICERDTLILVEPCLSIGPVLGAVRTPGEKGNIPTLRKIIEELKLVRNSDLILLPL